MAVFIGAACCLVIISTCTFLAGIMVSDRSVKDEPVFILAMRLL